MSNQNYGRIFKSTAVIGGASGLNIVFKIIQAKAAAVLLGPQGVGLMGLFNSVAGLATTLAGMGLGTSGVRAIAAAAESGDEIAIGHTTAAFRRITFILAGLGGIAVFLLREWISQITFGSQAYAGAIGWLALVVFLTVVAIAQTAFIRGMRRIGDLARVSVLGVASGTLLGIPVLYWRGVQGVVFYLLIVAGTTLLVSWWYARRIPVARVRISWKETVAQARALLPLGVAFMSAGLITVATTYLVKVFVTRQAGIEATGLYQAANALANVYVGFILSAMGADFFPHLSGVAHDDLQSNRLINEQAQIGTLLAVPGILGMLALGPWLLQLLYSAEFSGAFEIFRWQALGTFLRVTSWPLGFLLLAKGKGTLFIFSELASNLLYLGASWLALGYWGVAGAGVAFFILYVFYNGLMLVIARQLTGFRWAKASLRLFAWVAPGVLAGFLFSYLRAPWLALALGLGLAALAGIFALKSLRDLLGAEIFNAALARLRQRLPSRKN